MTANADFTTAEEGLIRPIKRRTDPSIGPNVLQVLIGMDLDYLIRRKGPDGFERHNLDFFRLFTAKDTPEGSLSLCGPFLGAPQAVMGLERMIALGARKIWVLGWCGSLQHNLKIGDLVIPATALIEEGTSRHYPIGDREPCTDPQLNDALEAALKAKRQTYRKGGIWTTDAPFRETPSKITAYRERGLLAVEMELSALMTVALYRGVKLSALLVVSDELADLKWRHGFSDPRFRKATRAAAEILFELAAGQNPRIAQS